MVVVDGIIDSHARIAVYDDMLSSPRIIEVAPAPTNEFIEGIAAGTYENARAQGGVLPYTVIREITENFIHADFKECTVSVLDGGNTVRFSDQGPGIERKDLVLQPGVSSATSSRKRYIRGVGSGFPIVREYLERSNGYLSIDDNAIDGTVVTLAILPQDKFPLFSQKPAPQQLPPTHPSRHEIQEIPESSHPNTAGSFSSNTSFLQENAAVSIPSSSDVPRSVTPVLRERDKQALLLLFEEGMLGSGDLVKPLGISAPTATRLIKRHEEFGLVEQSLNKKRILSNKGLAYVQAHKK